METIPRFEQTTTNMYRNPHALKCIEKTCIITSPFSSIFTVSTVFFFSVDPPRSTAASWPSLLCWCSAPARWALPLAAPAMQRAAAVQGSHKRGRSWPQRHLGCFWSTSFRGTGRGWKGGPPSSIANFVYIYIIIYIYNIMIHYIVSLGPLQLMKLEGEGYHGPPFFTPIRGCRAGRRWHSHPETEKLVRTPGVGDWTGPGGKMWKKNGSSWWITFKTYYTWPRCLLEESELLTQILKSNSHFLNLKLHIFHRTHPENLGAKGRPFNGPLPPLIVSRWRMISQPWEFSSHPKLDTWTEPRKMVCKTIALFGVQYWGMSFGGFLK